MPGGTAAKRQQNARGLIEEGAVDLQRHFQTWPDSPEAVSDWVRLIMTCVAADPVLAPNQFARMHAAVHGRPGREEASKAEVGEFELTKHADEYSAICGSSINIILL